MLDLLPTVWYISGLSVSPWLQFLLKSRRLLSIEVGLFSFRTMFSVYAYDKWSIMSFIPSVEAMVKVIMGSRYVCWWDWILLDELNMKWALVGCKIRYLFSVVRLLNLKRYTVVKESLNITRYSDVIMGGMASQISGFSIVCSTVCSDADQRKHLSSASLAFVRVIYWSSLDCPNKGQWRGKCTHLMSLSWILKQYINKSLQCPQPSACLSSIYHIHC